MEQVSFEKFTMWRLAAKIKANEEVWVLPDESPGSMVQIMSSFPPQVCVWNNAEDVIQQLASHQYNGTIQVQRIEAVFCTVDEFLNMIGWIRQENKEQDNEPPSKDCPYCGNKLEKDGFCLECDDLPDDD